jgi:ArsR family transcriptional regulator
MLKALAHPVRLQMVALLHQAQGQLCVCELEAHFALAQPTISHHLKVLRQAGLITGEGRGVWIYYAIRPEAMTQLGTLLHSLGAQAGQA